MSFMKGIFNKEEKKEKTLYDLQSEWVYKFYNSPNHNQYYYTYLNNFFMANNKNGIISDLAQVLSYADFEKDRIETNRKRIEEIKEKKLKKRANMKIKGLSNAEKYLIKKAGLDRGHTADAVGNYVEGSNLKTDAELKQAIARMRKRVKYAMLKKLDLKLRALESPVTIKSFENFDYHEKKELYYWHSDDLRNFIIAENDIEGMTEEEIKKHSILEEI